MEVATNRIIAVHGQLGLASDWDQFADLAMNEQYKLEAVDLWKVLAEDELSLIEFGTYLNTKYKSGDVLLGYSMGGRLALHALVADPAPWKAIIIVSAHLGLLNVQAIEERRKIDDEWSRKAKSSSWIEFLTEWNQQSVLSGKSVLNDRLELENRRAEIDKAFRNWSLSEQENLMPKLVGIDVPILFVAGEEDKKFHDHLGTVVQNLNQPNIEFLSIPNVGHRVPWEAEALFAEKCFEWLIQQS